MYNYPVLTYKEEMIYSVLIKEEDIAGHEEACRSDKWALALACGGGVLLLNKKVPTILEIINKQQLATHRFGQTSKAGSQA